AFPPAKPLSKNLVNGSEITFEGSVKVDAGDVVYCMDGREVFRATFHTDTYASVFFEKLKTNDSYLHISDEQRSRFRAEVQKRIRTEGSSVISDERWAEIEADALRDLGLRLLDESIKNSAKRMSDNLPQAIALIFRKLAQASFFAGANSLRDTLAV